MLRLKFGPRIDATLARPLPDVAVAAVIAGVRPSASPDKPETLDVSVRFDIEPAKPGESVALDHVRVVFVPDGQPEPATPAEAVDSPYPYGTADATGHAAGGALELTVEGVPFGKAVGLTVLAYNDPEFAS